MPKDRSGGTSGGATGGAGGRITASKSLISERERYGQQVDEALSVLRDIEDEYGVNVEDTLVSEIKDRGSGTTLGYYDTYGNVAINDKLFKNPKSLDKMYDSSVKSGYHPARGNKSGLQAVMAHELGHRLNYIAGGSTWDGLDSSAETIVRNAAKASGQGSAYKQFRSKVSGYARKTNAEAVAESFADVYLNGSNAKAESRAIYNELRKMLGR